MNRSHLLIAVGVVAVAASAVVASGAFPFEGGLGNSDEAARGVYLNPAESPNGESYAEIGEDGKLDIRLQSLNRDATVRVDDLFSVTTRHEEARIWVDDGESAVTFYEMTSGEPIESEDQALTLTRHETATIGVKADTAGGQLSMESVDIVAQVPERGRSDEARTRGANVVVRTDDGRILVEIRNGDGGKIVSVQPGETSAMRSSGVHISSMDVTPACDGNTTVYVDTMSGPSKSTPDGTVPMFAYDVTLDGQECGLSDSTVTLQVDRNEVDGRDADPEDLAVYHLPGPAGTWESASSAYLGVSGGHYVYEVTADSFSEFALAVQQPSFETTKLSVDDDAPEPGETFFVTGTVENVGQAEGSTELQLTAGGDVVATETVTLAPDESATIGQSVTFEEAGNYEVALGSKSLTVSVGAVETETTDDGTETDAGPTGDDEAGDESDGDTDTDGESESPTDGQSESETVEFAGLSLPVLAGAAGAVVLVSAFVLWRRVV